MEAHEKEKMLADLRLGKEALLDFLAGVTEEIAARSGSGDVVGP